MKFLFALALGFTLGIFFCVLLMSGNVKAEPLYLACAFVGGFVVCLFAIFLFARSLMITAAKKVKDEEYREKWWQRGESPPWDSYRDEDGGTLK